LKRFDPNEIRSFGPFLFDTANGILTRAGQDVKLQSKTVAVLKLFVENPGVILSRQTIKDAIWNGESVVDNSVDQRVAELRRVFEAANVAYLETRPKQGWRFIAPVEIATGPHHPGEAPERAEQSPRSVAADEPMAQASSSRPMARDARGIPEAVFREGDPASPSFPNPDFPKSFVPSTFARRKWHFSSSLLILAGALFAAAAAGLWLHRPIAVRRQGAVEVRIGAFTQLTVDGRIKSGPLSTDGQNVYFTEFPRGQTYGDRVQAAVGLRALLGMTFPSPPAPALLLVSIASRGERLFSDWRTGALFLQTQPGRPAHAVYNMRDNARLSPDASAIAVGGTASLSIRNLLRNTDVSVGLPGPTAVLAWRPDGKSVWVVVRDPATEFSSMWEVDRWGQWTKRLPFAFPEGIHIYDGSWTPDAQTFVFSELPGVGSQSELWTASSDGFGDWMPPVRVDSQLSLSYPVVAQDDSAVFGVGAKYRDEIVRYDVYRREFVPVWKEVPAVDLAFSHDGNFAAFVQYPDLTLWISNADGSSRRQITRGPFAVNQPHWSPDDREISFMAHMPSEPWRDYVVPASGGAFHEILASFPLEPGSATWSKDGRYMVFGERRDLRGPGDMQVHLVEMAHGVITALPDSRGKWSPRWSPDGRFILATTTDFGSLWVYDWAKKKWCLLTRMTNIDSAEWSPNSKFIQFSALHEYKFGVFRIDVGSGQIQRVADLPQDDQYVSLSVAPDCDVIGIRQVRTDEIYRIDWKRSVEKISR
jgi:DNA-binding winged helix-turn-helix (wHTH) protein/Tol biopolymer transport system component